MNGSPFGVKISWYGFMQTLFVRWQLATHLCKVHKRGQNSITKVMKTLFFYNKYRIKDQTSKKQQQQNKKANIKIFSGDVFEGTTSITPNQWAYLLAKETINIMQSSKATMYITLLTCMQKCKEKGSPLCILKVIFIPY